MYKRQDAYRKVGADIASGNFKPNKDIRHTHEGSIGNLCNEEIRVLMDEVWNGFHFEQIEEAERQLANEE